MGLMAQFVDRLGIMYAGRLVEVAPIGEIVTAPRHPYTRMLIASLPSLDQQGRVARHSRPGAAAARPAAGLRLPSALPAGRRIAAAAKSRRCGRWARMPSWPAISRRPRMSALLRAEHAGKTYRRRHDGAGERVADDRRRSGRRSPPWSARAAAARPRSPASCSAWIAPTTGRVLLSAARTCARCPARDGADGFRRDVQAIFQDPYEVYNPFYRVDHVLTTPVRKFRLAKTRAEARGADRDGAARGRAAAGGDPRPLPAPAQRRPAPAHHGGARAAAAAEADRRRRAGVDGRCLAARDDPRHRCARCTRRCGISIVYITHDLATAYQISHNILVMYRAARGGGRRRRARS